MRKTVRKRESGYALLFIFLTVAIIGIMYYAAMPHVVFEAQRDQEQMLIDRGEQYKRAIQLYYRKFKKYPAKIDDLENTNGQRFLRQRYKDPMTGKDEWRAIHIGANGQFIDSLTQKGKQKTQDPASVNNFITELKPLGDTGSSLNAPVNLGLRHRPSDAGGGNGDSNGGSNGNLSNPDADPLLEAPNDMIPGPNGSLVPANPVAQSPGAIGPNGAPVNGINPNNFNPNNPNANNANNGFQNQSGQQGQNPSGADVIRNLLTSPRPGGAPPGIFTNQPTDSGSSVASNSGSIGQQNQFPQATSTTNVGGFNGASGGGLGSGNNTGTPVSALSSQTGGSSIGGGGIAGFASKAERPGIKIYNEKKKYNEWEFIYDYAKDPTMGGGQTVPQNGNNNLNGPGTAPNGTNPGSPLGGGNGVGASGSTGLGGSGLGSSGGSSSPSSPPSPSTGP